MPAVTNEWKSCHEIGRSQAVFSLQATQRRRARTEVTGRILWHLSVRPTVPSSLSFSILGRDGWVGGKSGRETPPSLRDSRAIKQVLFPGQGTKFSGEWTSTLRRRSIVLFSISPRSAGCQ